MSKFGIVMEGGASRTIFSCGVTDALLEADIMPDYFIGVSAGIAFGVSYLSKQKGRNWEMTEKYMADKRYMGLSHLRKTKNFYNVPFVFSEIPNELIPFDYEALRNFPGEVEVVVTNVKTGEAEYMELERKDQEFKKLLASCALPVLFQPVKIGKNYYLDGGIADSIPIERALEKGCNKVLVILTRQRDYVKKTEKGKYFSNFVYQKCKNLCDAMDSRPERYNACKKRLEELEEEGKVFLIAPEDTLGISRTEKDPKVLRPLYDQGYELMQEKMDELRAFIQSDS